MARLRRSRTIWWNSLRPTAKAFRTASPLRAGHFEEHVLERGGDHRDRRVGHPGVGEPTADGFRYARIAAGQHGMDGRAENTRLLDVFQALEQTHHIHRALRPDLDNRPAGEDRL